MDLAYREDTGEPIVVRKQEIIPQTQVIEVSRFDGPLVTILAVVAVYLLCYFVVRRYTPLPWRILRCALYVIFGLAGIVLWFLSLFSAHPHTLLNANMVLLHPFWLILVVTMWQEGRHKRLNSHLYLINLSSRVLRVARYLTTVLSDERSTQASGRPPERLLTCRSTASP